MDERRRRRALTTGLLLTMSLHATHGLAVVTALPIVARELDGRALYGAALAAYLLASLVGLASAGARSDRRGLAPTFGIGAAIFGSGIGVCAVAPSMAVFVAWRGGASRGSKEECSRPCCMRPSIGRMPKPNVLACSPGCRRHGSFPASRHRRSRAGSRSIWAGVWSSSGCCPESRWRAGWRCRRCAGSAARGPVRSRVGPALQLAVGTAMATTGLGIEAPGAIRVGLALLGTTLVAPALRALMPEGIFRLRGVLPSAIAAKTLLAFAFFAADSFLPLVFIDLHGTSAAFAGWVLTVGSLTWSAGALAQAQLADRVSPGAWIAVGAALLFLGLATCAVTLRPDASLVFAFVGWGLAGFAMGLAYNATSALAMTASVSGQEGQTSTWLGLADALGVGLATSLGGVWLAVGERGGVALGSSLAGLWALALGVTMLIVVAGVRLIGPGAAEPTPSV